jgi:hypothetical protein
MEMNFSSSSNLGRIGVLFIFPKYLFLVLTSCVLSGIFGITVYVFLDRSILERGTGTQRWGLSLSFLSRK